jgi:hypothetical protein
LVLGAAFGTYRLYVKVYSLEATTSFAGFAKTKIFPSGNKASCWVIQRTPESRLLYRLHVTFKHTHHSPLDFPPLFKDFLFLFLYAGIVPIS